MVHKEGLYTKFRNKPVVIDAGRIEEEIEIDTLEGVMKGRVCGGLITGVDGEKYPRKDSIFRKTYEPIDGERST